MPKPGSIFTGLLIVLAGCYTPPRHETGRPPDWSSAEQIRRAPPKTERAHVPVPPAPAPVVSNPPPVRPAGRYVDTWISLGRWGRENQTGSLRRISLTSLPTFAFTTSNGVLIVQANSRIARWNNLELHLGFDPQLIDDQPFVHVLDLKKNIEPLLRDFAVVEKTNRVVVIDPGHGGSNTGTTNVVDGTNEKEYTLDWAERLGSLLSTNGWQVFLTRTDDTEVALSNRVAFAEAHKADLFISLHFNSAAPNQEQNGLETFCLTPTGMPSTLIREFEDNPSLVFTNNAFDAENLRYALRFHGALLTAGGMADRGVRRARFLGVLRGQNRPAVLIEGGYLSNPQEARRIADPEYRQILAEAVAEALKPETRVEQLEVGELNLDSPASNLRPLTSGVPSSNSPTTNAAPF